MNLHSVFAPPPIGDDHNLYIVDTLPKKAKSKHYDLYELFWETVF